MTGRRLGPRVAALLAGGAFALHQLRYLLGYGSDSHAELGAQGHAYLAVLAPLVGAGLLAIAADFGVRLFVARARSRAATAPSMRTLWAAASGCLLAAYALQETAEGALSASHPAGLTGLAAHGGWVALPLSAALGLAIALVVRGAGRALELATEPPLRVGRPRRLTSLTSIAPAAPAIARGARRRPAARGPPLAAVP
jgi:hypothetical protein